MHPRIFTSPEHTSHLRCRLGETAGFKNAQRTRTGFTTVLGLYVLRIGTVLRLRLMTCYQNASTQVQTRTRIEKRPIYRATASTTTATGLAARGRYVSSMTTVRGIAARVQLEVVSRP